MFWTGCWFASWSQEQCRGSKGGTAPCGTHSHQQLHAACWPLAHFRNLAQPCPANLLVPRWQPTASQVMGGTMER